MTKDMTKGSPWRLIFFFTVPVLLGNIFQQLYSMVDTIIVGRFVSVQALAAVGATGSISFLVIGFATGITSGFGIVIAQKFGAGDEKAVRRSVGVSIVLCIIITIILTILSLTTSRFVLELMNTPDDIINDAVIYINIIYAGIFATIYYNMVASILRALGDSKTPLYFLILSSILNVVLDLVLIINFHMGVAGAGIATVFSQFVSAVLCTIYTIKRYPILKLKKSDFRVNKTWAWAHLRVGLPMALQFSVTAVGVMVLQSALNVFGSEVIASFTAASKVETLVTQTMNSLGTTMATFCGQNLGAGKWRRIKKGMQVGMIFSAGCVLIAALINFTLGTAATRLFMTDPSDEIIGYARTYLYITTLFYPFLAAIYLFRNSLQGMGDAMIPMIGGVAELISRLGVAVILPIFIGYIGVCLASPAAWFVTGMILTVRYILLIKKQMRMQAE
ncbi:MAG TPA: MATE family efflux transporter [Candidatus Scybalocola faecipullorum]|nr:MATE family efflux transporter [Candidatus Scybalocola faecipullorum]